jgi:hypothetical protein
MGGSSGTVEVLARWASRRHMTSQCSDLGARSQRAGTSPAPGSPSPVIPWW